jgi:integrase
MPTLFKRSNGFYYTILTDEFGRRKWFSTKARTKQAALRKLTEISNPERGVLPRVMLQSFFDDFKAYAEQVYSPETVVVYYRAFTKFIEHVGNRALTSISARQIDSLRVQRLREVSPVTVNIELRTLRSAFNTALRWRLIRENPFKEVQLCPIADVAPPYFSLLEFQKLIGGIKQDWFRNVVIVAVLTGMRRGEILNLRWSDVDLEKRVIKIESTGNFRTKMGKRRIVPMNPQVLWIIEHLDGTTKNEFVFAYNGRRIQERTLSLRFKRLVRQLKLDDKMHFHSLRHTFASWLVQGGATLYEVQRLLGHSSSKVTEIYSHLQPEQMHNTVNKIVISMN